MKKLVVLILSIALALNCLAVTAFADDNISGADIPVNLTITSIYANNKMYNYDDTVRVNANSRFDVYFTIDVPSEYQGGYAYATVNGSGFTVDGATEMRSVSLIDKIPVYVDTSLTTGRYPVTVTITYIKDGKTATASQTLNVNVVGIPDTTTDIPEIEGNVSLTINSAPEDEIFPGHTFDITFTSNLVGVYSYGYGVSGVVTVSGDGFSLAGALAEEDISTGRNTVKVLCEGGSAGGRKQLTLTVTYTVNGQVYTASRTLNIDVVGEEEIDEPEENNDKAAFSLTSASIPEGKGRSNLATTLKLGFTNKTDFDAENLKIRIASLGDLILNTYTDTVDIGTVGGGKSVDASFPIKFAEYPSVQTTVTVELAYDAPAGPQTESFNVYLQATEKKKDDETGTPETAALTPKVIVKSYSVDVDNVTSGEEFTLSVVLENTSAEKDLRNMTVNVTPQAYSSGANGSSSGPVFSFIDGTSSFYTDLLEKSGTIEYSIRLKCSASAGAGSYPIDIDFNFEYAQGGGYASGNGSMSINLPVIQPVKFDLMDWYPPEECGPDGTYISFQYFNKSRNPMSALAITVEGDFEMPTQYVGSLAASSYDYFSGMITPVDPSAIGETKTAILVFTFEDAADNEQRIEYPFDVMITEGGGMFGDDMMWSEDMWGDDMMWGGIEEPVYGEDGLPVDGDNVGNGGLPLWAKIAIPAGAVVVLGAGGAVVAKKVKAKREEEDDEEV